jgi:hypothetical protein
VADIPAGQVVIDPPGAVRRDRNQRVDRAGWELLAQQLGMAPAKTVPYERHALPLSRRNDIALGETRVAPRICMRKAVARMTL